MNTQQQWNNAAEWFDQNTGNGDDELNGKIIDQFIFESLSGTSDKIILDCGSGNGYLSAKLTTEAKKVIAIDFAENFIKLSQKKYAKIHNLKFLQHDIAIPMPFSNNFFDFVISKMVLQYVKDISVFAKEAYRILNNNGNLIVTVDHPFHTQFYYAQKLAGKPNPKYPTLRDYFDQSEQSKISLWGKVELTWYPRKISDYINTFINSGFILTVMKELPEIQNNIKVPRILGLVFQRRTS